VPGRAPKKPVQKRAQKAVSTAARGRVTKAAKAAHEKASLAALKGWETRRAAAEAKAKAERKAARNAKKPERAPRAGSREKPAPAATAKKRGPHAGAPTPPGRLRGAPTPSAKQTAKKAAKKRAAPTPEGKARYAKRIATLMALGYTRSQARGHAKYKKGEVGIVFDKDAAVAVITSGSPAERLRTRAALIEAFALRVDEPVAKFPNRRAWWNRVSKYQGIADWLERLFGIEQPEAFALLMSP